MFKRLTKEDRAKIREKLISYYPQHAPRLVTWDNDHTGANVFLHLTTNSDGSQFFQRVHMGVAKDFL